MTEHPDDTTYTVQVRIPWLIVEAAKTDLVTRVLLLKLLTRQAELELQEMING